MNKLLAAVAALGILLYPLLVYFGLTRFQPRYLALLLGFLVLVRLVAGGFRAPLHAKGSKLGQANNLLRYAQLAAALFVFGLVTYVVTSNNAESLKLYPVIISFSLLCGFVWSLLYPPSAIERIARISEPQLPAAGIRYTRTITLVWCGFFLCNGLAALYTALYASSATWALYNGLIAYVLIGCLLGGEFLYRHLHLKKGKPPSS